jgi:hypothetical protein
MYFAIPCNKASGYGAAYWKPTSYNVDKKINVAQGKFILFINLICNNFLRFDVHAMHWKWKLIPFLLLDHIMPVQILDCEAMYIFWSPCFRKQNDFTHSIWTLLLVAHNLFYIRNHAQQECMKSLFFPPFLCSGLRVCDIEFHCMSQIFFISNFCIAVMLPCAFFLLMFWCLACKGRYLFHWVFQLSVFHLC